MPDNAKSSLDQHADAVVFDRGIALARVGGDKDLLHEIAQLFLEDYPRAVAELHSAAALGDPFLVERTAHRLKGAVANFGAAPVVNAAFTLEQMGRSKNLDGIGARIETLESALATLQSQLRSL